MTAERELLMREAGYEAPEAARLCTRPCRTLGRFPGAGFDTFDGLAELLPRYEELGINAVIIGGRTWNCYYDRDPKSGADGFIPIPRDGKIVPFRDHRRRAWLRDWSPRLIHWG